MKLIDQKLGNVGELKVEIAGGKLVIGVDGDLDLVAQLEKLKAAHQTGILGDIITVVEDALAKVQ